MIIETIEVFGVAVPLVGAFSTSYQSTSEQRSAIVRLVASDGTVGLGNVDPVPGYSEETTEATLDAIAHRLAPVVLGTDPRNLHRLLALMDRTLPRHFDAKAAIEMACCDLSARAQRVSVATLLGGAVRDTVRFNAWIGIVPPGRAADEAAGWKARGFASAKGKVGHDVDADVERLRAIREATGPHWQIRIDANAGYDADTAIALARRVEPLGLELFEQPVPADDIAGLARVRRACPFLPIMADESVTDHASLLAVLRADAADLVKVKPMKQGGLLTTRRLLATAEAAGVRCVLGHGFGLGVNTLAEIMLGASAPNVIDGLECVGPLKTADDIVRHKLDLGSGSLEVPAGPGLGAELDPDRIERYRVFHHRGAIA
ncbi:MAG TPA: enolase C-terminal domain-like protein [Burkholderiaceae bacterium]|nr:enolase C-terminal domain-like protein [Burkholderiaceae bacterium]